MSENIMDIASQEMTDLQIEQLQTLAEARAESETTSQETLANVLGSNDIPTFRFRKPRPVVKDYNVHRNDPCPCGSGKKYKKCCLDSGKYESTHTV